MTPERINEILLAAGSTGERQVWFTRKEVVAALQAAVAPVKELVELAGKPPTWGGTYTNHKGRVECCDCGGVADAENELILHEQDCPWRVDAFAKGRMRELARRLATQFNLESTP